MEYGKMILKPRSEKYIQKRSIYMYIYIYTIETLLSKMTESAGTAQGVDVALP